MAEPSAEITEENLAGLDEERREALTTVLVLTRAMESAAGDDDWDRVRHAQEQREPVLQAFLAQPVGVEEAPVVGAAIRAIQDSDARVSELAVQAREATAQALTELQQRKEATRAYRQQSG